MFEQVSEVELCDLVREERGESELGRTAFAELYSRGYGLAMATAYRLLGDRHRAEDVVSEAFVKILRALQRGRGPSDSFNAYLITAVRSEAFRGTTTEQATFTVASEELEERSRRVEPDGAVRIAERDQLMRAFESLPEAWRRVLYLIDVVEEPRAEAAELMGSSLRAMNSLLHRAREALRTSYLQQYVEGADPECSGAVSAMGQFVRGGLKSKKKAAVAAHLEGCAACSAQLSSLIRINESLRIWIGPSLVGVGSAGGMVLSGNGSTGSDAAQSLDDGGIDLSILTKKTLLLKRGLLVKLWAGIAGVVILIAIAAVVLWPHPALMPLNDFPSLTGAKGASYVAVQEPTTHSKTTRPRTQSTMVTEARPDTVDISTPAGAENPLLALQTSANATLVSNVGEEIEFAFLVSNSGDVALAKISVNDRLESTITAESQAEANCPDTSLAAGESFTCTTWYEVTQADLVRGSVSWSAVASGELPRGGSIESTVSTVTVEVGTVAPTAAPKLALRAGANTTEVTNLGENVEYQFSVKNTGDVALTNVGVTVTSFTGDTSKLGTTICAENELLPAAEMECTAAYSVTQGDLDRGTIDYTASAQGRLLGSNDEVQSSVEGWSVIAAGNPTLVLAMMADRNDLPLGVAVRYTFALTNAGNVTLQNPTINIASFSGNSALLSPITCPTSTLAPGDAVECWADYVVQQADVTAGVLTSRATASATPITGAAITTLQGELQVMG